MFDAVTIFSPEVNHGVAALGFANAFGPEDFHEIAGTRFAEIVEVSAESKLMKQPCGAGPVCVPSSPNSFAVALVANHELTESGEVQVKLPPLSQMFQSSDEHEISGAGTKARRCSRGKDEKLAGLEVGCGLKSNFGYAAHRVIAADRHGAHLLQHEGVEVLGGSESGAEAGARDYQESFF